VDWVTNLLQSYLRLAVAILVCAVLGVAGCSSPQPIEPSQLVDIHWVSAYGFERAGLFVDASVGGQRGRVQLDTGARTTFMRPMLDSCNIPYTLGKSVAWDDLPGAQWATVSDVSLGNFRRRKMKVIVWDGPAADTEGVVECDSTCKLGNLGWDFVGDGTLYLDFGEDKVAVFERRPQLSGTIIPFERTVGGRPVIHIKIGSEAFSSMIDTGSSAFTLLVDPEDVARIAGPADPVEVAAEFTVSSWGRPVKVTMYQTPLRMDLARERLQVQEFYASPLISTLRKATRGQVTSILGNDAFRGMKMAIDFRAKELILVDN